MWGRSTRRASSAAIGGGSRLGRDRVDSLARGGPARVRFGAVASIVEVFGNCRVVATLASGPLTDVYHAVQDPLGRHVAIKALRSTMSPNSPFAAPLVREAELLSRLSHENILRIYDFLRTPDAMWLVLEYVEGVSLADLLGKVERLTVHAAAAIGIEVCRALAHAHARGIIHRDVKPSNILLSREGGLKLVDFGIAHDDRAPSCPETLEAGATYGTPAYMSPEQILGDKIDARTDLFSLGIVLYQAVAGRRPFEAPDTKSTAQRIRHSDPPPLSSTDAPIPRLFERVVARCLEKVPGDRWMHANELASQLEAYLRRETTAPTHDLILAELARAKVVESLPKLREMHAAVRSHAARGPLWPVAGVYVALLLLVVVGGAVIEQYAHRADESVTIQQGPLELAPMHSGHLRVVARPWADVIVDGQRLDVTPLGHPIPLSAGIHYITFKHPKASDERRVVRIEPGQSVLLDVNMLPREPSPSDAGVD